MVYYLPMETFDQANIHAAIACLQRLTDIFQQRRVQLAQSVGLSEQQWAVLEEISSEHFMPSMFAKSRASSAAAVSKILRQLADKQLVRSKVDSDDGRQRRYELTAKGKAKMTTIRQKREQAINAVWVPLEVAQLETFTRIGEELTERLEAYAMRSE
jgi:DNA-binding MarR family transcriptional regulator